MAGKNTFRESYLKMIRIKNIFRNIGQRELESDDTEVIAATAKPAVMGSLGLAKMFQ